VQDFLRNIVSGDSIFPSGYSGQALRDKACLLATDFNPDDFVEEKQNVQM
jgi:hypothetical protein